MNFEKKLGKPISDTNFLANTNTQFQRLLSLSGIKIIYSSGACQCATFIWFRKNAENGFFQNIFLSINFLNTSYISSCREQNSLQEYVYNMS